MDSGDIAFCLLLSAALIALLTPSDKSCRVVNDLAVAQILPVWLLSSTASVYVPPVSIPKAMVTLFLPD
jgi:hypothetical protein